MKKVIALLIVIICIVVAGIFMITGWGSNTPIVNSSGEFIPPTIPLADTIEIRNRSRNNESTRIHISTNWPEITNLPNFEKQEIINNKIANSINPYIDEISVVAEGITTIVHNDNIMDTKLYNYTVSYDRYNNDKYLSLVVNQDIRISVAGSEAGGLRSNKWKDIYNIDCATSNEVTLRDICDFANYKAIIVEEINKQAKSQQISLAGDYGLVDIPDSQRFYIKDSKLYIYFEPASIAPYLLGELDFEMPFRYNTSTGKFDR